MSETSPVPAIAGPGEGRFKLFIRKLEPHYRKVKRYVIAHKTGRLLTVQISCAAIALVGIALIWSAPIALVVGGIGGILAVERQ